MQPNYSRYNKGQRVRSQAQRVERKQKDLSVMGIRSRNSSMMPTVLQIESRRPSHQRSKKSKTESRDQLSKSYVKAFGKNLLHYNRLSELMKGRESISRSKETRRKESKDSMFTIQRESEYELRYSIRSRRGSSGEVVGDKPNQDLPFAITNIQGKSYQHFFAVCDGHGLLGHRVAALVETYFRAYFKQFNFSHDYIQTNYRTIFPAMFGKVAEQLLSQTEVDAKLSGCTCVALFFNNDSLYCLNVGDSRCILGKAKKGATFQTVKLSVEHKPDLASEYNRIMRMGGRVCKSLMNPDEQILRFYNKLEKGPGLALTRAFGDSKFISSGLTSAPDIFKHSLSRQDRYLVLGSDGLFQYLEDQQIIEECARHELQSEQAALSLVQKARNCWDGYCSSADDISAIVIAIAF